MINVNVIGAGGHARSLLSLIEENESIHVNGVFDASYIAFPNEKVGSTFLKGSIEQLKNKSDAIVLAVGNMIEKRSFVEQFTSQLFLTNLAAKSALVREDVQIGEANHIFPFAFVNSEVKIGSHCLINSRATIEHESIIGDFCHLSVGSIICGRVSVGNNTFIGAGSVVKDGVKICDNVIVGAGSVVVKDILEPGTYFGNPLRKVK